MTRATAGALVLLAVLAVGIGALAGGGLAVLTGSSPNDPGFVGAASSGGPGTGAGASGTPTATTPTPTPSPTPTPTPSPSPTPYLVPDPLDGTLVPPEDAARHPIAVMVDDLAPARPQSGFGAASVVWQAPAEGGIPRYMMVFSHGLAPSIGPVRSARYYFVAWAAEWRALYVHAGGSPQALTTLAAQGGGQLVYNADQFRYGHYFRRITTRFSPHNLYTTGGNLRELADLVGATAAPSGPVWTFGPDAPLEERPVGGRIEVVYPANDVQYSYDRETNTYLRTVSVEGAETDAATGQPVAPKNVIVMRMSFGPLNDGEPQKHRLEAKVVGSGEAWIATNGHTIHGTWGKKSLTAPTLFFDAAGDPVTLTAGQTFVQVVPLGWSVVIKDGKLPTAEPSASPGASGASPGSSFGSSPSPSPNPS